MYIRRVISVVLLAFISSSSPCQTVSDLHRNDLPADSTFPHISMRNGFDFSVRSSNAGTVECERCDVPLEYHADSCVEHLPGGGIWRGAVVLDSSFTGKFVIIK